MAPERGQCGANWLQPPTCMWQTSLIISSENYLDKRRSTHMLLQPEFGEHWCHLDLPHFVNVVHWEYLFLSHHHFTSFIQLFFLCLLERSLEFWAAFINLSHIMREFARAAKPAFSLS